MKINEIAFVCYPVTNLKIAKLFYEDLLGLKATNTWVKDDTNGFIEYDLGSSTLAIGAGAPTFSPGKSGPCVSLEVADFDSAVKQLKENKIKFLMEPSENPMCHMILIEDPDGNQLMIHKRKPKQDKNAN